MSNKPSSPQVNGDLTLPFDISVANSKPTQTRIPSIKADSVIKRIGTPRANAAVSTTAPEGDKDYTRRFKDYTVLQQHVLFWDRDADGQIYPLDTYTGFRELGFNMVFSLLAMVIIHSGFSYPTRLGHSWLPDPLFRVYVGSIHKAKVSWSKGKTRRTLHRLRSFLRSSIKQQNHTDFCWSLADALSAAYSMGQTVGHTTVRVASGHSSSKTCLRSTTRAATAHST
jgi:hypothetical protein